MTRGLIALVGVALFTTAVALTAQRRPLQPCAGAKADARARAAATNTAESQTALIKQYLRHLSQRSREDRRVVAGGVRRRPRGGRHRADREDDPQAARRHDAARRARRPAPEVLAALVEALENRVDAAAALRRRIRAGVRFSDSIAPSTRARSRTCSTRSRCRRAAARRHDQRRLRQHRRRADVFANAADGVSSRGGQDHRARDRRSRCAARRGELQSAEDRVAIEASRGRSARHPRRHSPTVHVFPADGEYVFRMELHANACGVLFGGPTSGEQIEVSVDGERVAMFDINPRMTEAETGLTLKTPPIYLRAGPARVTAAFLQRFEGPVVDLLAPIDHTLADTQIGVAFGITTLPHLKDLAIVGPYRSTGISDTPSRRKVFTCRPTSAGEEASCAREIVRRLASDAFRGPVAENDFAALMRFYEDGRAEGDFESGSRTPRSRRFSSSPQFLFRLEPVRAAASARGRAYRIGDRELASRLSFFLWGRPGRRAPQRRDRGPPQRAGGVGEAGPADACRIRNPKRLPLRFATQWLRLNDVDEMLPDALLYPYFDHSLGQAFKRETQLFFDSIVREDRSVLDLLTADYTFVNERIARHYGIPNVTGPAFRRVTLPEYRRGILGHGSMLVLTSVADRTSPVMRGKWVMEVLLGSPPPPPPADVPPFDATKAAAGGKLLSVRERMEEHRRNPACTSCHRVIDPLGLALDNFDVTGKWRIKDNEVAVDSTGVLYDGTPMNGPAGLREALLKHQDAVLLSFTERLMTFALGRRLSASDMPAVRHIVKTAGREENRMSSFVLGVVRSAAFQSTHWRADRRSPLRRARTSAAAKIAMTITSKPLPRRTVLKGLGARSRCHSSRR